MVFPLVSGINNVTAAHKAMMPEKRPNTPLRPKRSATVPNASAVSRAPAFPDAAAMPCAVPRTLVGKTSTGSKKVVALGPAFRKN